MTTPYVSGTVSVTAGNAVVTGVGTGWAAALLTGGMFGLDSANGNPVPIASIDSDTQLTLAKPWRGTTAATQAYWIMRDTAYGQQTVANATALAQIINELRSAALASLAGLTPAADKVPYFTSSGAAALADIKGKGRDILAAADAAAAWLALGEIPNAQIPARIRQLATAVSASGSLSSITETGVVAITTTGAVATVGGPDGAPAGVCLTIMSAGADSGVQIYYGYSGSADRSWTRRKLGNVWQTWQLTSIPIVGTVSQISGQPFGAIIERGSNANGEYVRFADGTQICWGASNPTTTGSANNYFGSTSGAAVFANDTVSFPAAFANNSYRLTLNPTFRGFVVLAGYSKTNSAATSRVGNPGTTMTEVPYDWIANGRWY